MCGSILTNLSTSLCNLLVISDEKRSSSSSNQSECNVRFSDNAGRKGYHLVIGIDDLHAIRAQRIQCWIAYGWIQWMYCIVPEVAPGRDIVPITVLVGLIRETMHGVANGVHHHDFGRKGTNTCQYTHVRWERQNKVQGRYKEGETDVKKVIGGEKQDRKEMWKMDRNSNDWGSKDRGTNLNVWSWFVWRA